MPTNRLFLLLALMLPQLVFAQFANVLTFGGAAGNENGHQMLSDQAGGFYIGGTFDAAFAPAGDPLPRYGEEDLFLGHVAADGSWQWIKSGGSFLNDELRILRPLPGGDLLMAGTFWLEFTYGELQLNSTGNILGIFVIRLAPNGVPRWARVINGADQKQIGDVKIAASGEIYLTGYFSESLEFDSLQLQATGRNDAFLLKLNPAGELLDWQQLGYKGRTRGQTLALHPDGGYYWGGIYDDTLRIDTLELYANTFDRDVFVVRYDAAGQALWARRAGGVFEEELVAMATDPAGNLFATGFLIGVMSFSETVSIQSRNGNPDLFLFSYNDAGQIQWARSIGGNLIDQPTSLLLLDDQLIIGGAYQQQMAWDSFVTPLNSGGNGFLAGFSAQDGSGRWLLPVTSASFAFVEALDLDAEGRLFALGSFRDSAQWGSLSRQSTGAYDLFLAGIAPEVTPVQYLQQTLSVRIYPNPSRDAIRLEGLNSGELTGIRLYNSQHKLVRSLTSRDASTSVSLENLPAGQYWLTIQQGSRSATIPVMRIP